MVERILAAGSGVPLHQNTSEIYAQNSGSQKTGLLDGFHFRLIAAYSNHRSEI